MEDQKTKRRMWCSQCDMPTNNLLIYKGTKTRDGVVYAIFYSICVRCQVRKRASEVENVVSLEDYNALINKEIYA